MYKHCTGIYTNVCIHCTWVGDYDSLGTACGHHSLSEVIELHLYINDEQDWGAGDGEIHTYIERA